ncbi:probable histone-lysine N-methyltransferase set-23 [Zophobas morio]|uniref:probable histone-lysine N-methyltransferase set-23 n=1 Tax=Zophobas morio TaxID=2755281 RepID=UPI0030832836
MADLWDEYDHPDDQITYVVESLRSSGVEKSITHEYLGCNCEDKCIPETCSCLLRSGGHYSYEDKSQLQNYSLVITDKNKPVYECSPNCKCEPSRCGNRLVSFGPRSNLKIVTTPKGLGLSTERDIETGNFICEYAGEVITRDDAHKRFKKYQEMNFNHNYIFCINENFGDRNIKTFVDPTFYGNIGRYINHSCDPNCLLVPVRVEDEVPKLCIFAKEKIEVMNELTFDYGEGDGNISEKKKCLCMSHKCRKYLPFDGTI